MSTHATTANEPAWSWIIGGGLALILAGGAMFQMQFGGARGRDQFANSALTTVSGYETVTPGETVAPGSPIVESPDLAGAKAEDPVAPTTPRLQPWSPPAHQPDWLVAPCSPQRAAQVQQEWARHLGLPVEVDNSLGQKFRLIPPGIYDRGAQISAMESLLAAMPAEDTHWRDCLLSSTPAHRVVISKPFYLAVNETTQAEFQAITGRNPAWYSTTGPEPYYVEQVKGEDTARHPVEGITWNDAHDFARLLTRSVQGKLADVPHRNEISLATAAVSAGEIETGEQAALSDDKLRALVVQYRLPTDAEWEHACRGGTATPFSFGDKEPTVTGWFGEPNGGRTWEIGRGEANPLGLFGVHSGVWEWVEDQWSVNEYGRQMDWPVHDPHFTSATPLPRVVRGGMWPDRRSRSFDRYAYDSDFQTFFVGFRLAFDIPQAAD